MKFEKLRNIEKYIRISYLEKFVQFVEQSLFDFMFGRKFFQGESIDT